MDVVYVSPVLLTALNYCSASRMVYEVGQYKLQCIWEELNYGWDICRVTNGAHTWCLQRSFKCFV